MHKPDSHFYVNALKEGELTLDAEQSLHAVKACRASVGDELDLCDGLGHFAKGRISLASPKECRVVVECVEQSPVPAPRLHLALSCLKDDDIEEVVYHCTQLPIGGITLLRTEHSLEPRKSDLERTLRRCQAKSLVSLKQSRKPWLSPVEGPVYLQDWLRQDQGELIVCDPAGPCQAPEGFALFPKTSLLVGPEGGFSQGELDLMRAYQGGTHTHLLGLGATRLRAVTAPLFALGVLSSAV